MTAASDHTPATPPGRVRRHMSRGSQAACGMHSTAAFDIIITSPLHLYCTPGRFVIQTSGLLSTRGYSISWDDLHTICMQQSKSSASGNTHAHGAHLLHKHPKQLVCILGLFCVRFSRSRFRSQDIFVAFICFVNILLPKRHVNFFVTGTIA
jgi:hypothetical protein